MFVNVLLSAYFLLEEWALLDKCESGKKQTEDLVSTILTHKLSEARIGIEH